MHYPIATTVTRNNSKNHGLFLEASSSQSICLYVHGTAGNFYDDDFIPAIARELVSNGISFLSTNNAGSGVYDIYTKKGAAVEIFEECLDDIDAWIQFAIEKSYKKIFLCGHSLGCEKIVYYMSKGLYKNKIAKLALLSPADSPRWRLYDESYLPSQQGQESLNAMISEANLRIEQGKGHLLMDTDIEHGFMPRTPAALLSILGEDSELIKVMPFHTGRLEMVRAITIPMIAIIGNIREYTGIPPGEALRLLGKENSGITTHLLDAADHTFTGFEEEVAMLVREFLKT